MTFLERHLCAHRCFRIGVGGGCLVANEVRQLASKIEREFTSPGQQSHAWKTCRKQLALSGIVLAACLLRRRYRRAVLVRAALDLPCCPARECYGDCQRASQRGWYEPVRHNWLDFGPNRIFMQPLIRCRQPANPSTGKFCIGWLRHSSKPIVPRSLTARALVSVLVVN